MAGLAGTGQPAAGYAAAAGTVLVLLAAAAVRRDAGDLAAAARGCQARRGCRARRGRQARGCDGIPGLGTGYGMTAARMRQRLQASHAAEAAARRSAADMAGHLEQASRRLRRGAAIVHGFTGYCRKHGRPPPAALDQMMQRVTGEIGRMETLVDGLRTCPASPPHRIAGPIRPRPTQPPMPARRTPANRRPAATRQRDRPRQASTRSPTRRGVGRTAVKRKPPDHPVRRRSMCSHHGGLVVWAVLERSGRLASWCRNRVQEGLVGADDGA